MHLLGKLEWEIVFAIVALHGANIQVWGDRIVDLCCIILIDLTLDLVRFTAELLQEDISLDKIFIVLLKCWLLGSLSPDRCITLTWDKLSSKPSKGISRRS